ncbi:hypothetical protein IJ541_05875 [bacterium]|nr:hypothetical protein [bacterium]
MISKIDTNTSYIKKNTYNIGFGSSTENNMSVKQKAIVLASAAAGMTPVLAVMAKRKGFSLNPVKIFKTPIKDWALFKYAPKGKVINLEKPGNIIAIASGSVLGGFIGGALVDSKANLKAKKREVLNQILGNVLVPVGCVWAGAEAYDKFIAKYEKNIPQFKSTGKVLKVVNACLKNLPRAIGTITFLSAGIFAGNRVSNLINEKLYHRKVNRGVRATDFAPHVDDLCMAVSMMNKETELGSKIGRIIPLALLVPGYETGIAQEG